MPFSPGYFSLQFIPFHLSTKNLVGWISRFLIFSLIFSSLSVLALLSGKFLWLYLPTDVWNVSFQWCFSFLRTLFHSVIFSLYGAACSFFHGYCCWSFLVLAAFCFLWVPGPFSLLSLVSVERLFLKVWWCLAESHLYVSVRRQKS